MVKALLAGFIFWWFLNVLQSQSTEGFQWVMPMQSEFVPSGKASSDFVAVRGGKLLLVDVHANRIPLSYDSIQFAHHGYWICWKKGMQGVYHETKGQLVPPVYERVVPALKSADNWAFHVFKYGMNALVNDRNQLLIPYQKYNLGSFTFIHDTIIGYTQMGATSPSIDRLAYISYHGVVMSLPNVRKFFPPEFQRISADAYVLTRYKGEKMYTDTFPEAGKFEHNIAVVRKDSLWGYMLRDGTWLIPPRYQSAASFEKGRFAIVKSNGAYGAINLKGEYVVPAQHQVLKVTGPGYFEFKTDGKIGLLDSMGNTVVLPGEYAKFTSTGTQCVAAKSGDSLLIFRHDGTLVSRDRIMDAKGYRTASNIFLKRETGTKQERNQKGLWGMMAPDGRWIIEPVILGSVYERKHFVLVETRSDPCCEIGGLQYQQTQRNQYFIFDWTGKPYLSFSAVVSTAASTTQDERFLIYDLAGQFGVVTHLRQVFEPVYDEIKALGNGWLALRKGESWGVLKW